MKRVDLEPFDELIRQLRVHGHAAAAEAIATIKASAWTSASELLGELGAAVLQFQSRTPDAPQPLGRALQRCMKEVRKVWPRIGAS
jgi:hypothetical protein